MKEEERCDDSYNFPPPGAREDEQCGLREK
jgi:hypothetical protein